MINLLTGEILNFDPSQPRDEEGKWTKVGVSYGEKPESRELYGDYVDDGEILRENIADELDVSLDEITRAEQSWVQSYYTEEAKEILSAMADQGETPYLEVYRGLTFSDPKEQEKFIQGLTSSGYYQTKLESYTSSERMGEHFSTRAGASRLPYEKDKITSHGVKIQVMSDKYTLRGVELEYGESEVILPSDQVFKVESVEKREVQGFNQYLVKVRSER